MIRQALVVVHFLLLSSVSTDQEQTTELTLSCKGKANNDYAEYLVTKRLVVNLLKKTVTGGFVADIYVTDDASIFFRRETSFWFFIEGKINLETGVLSATTMEYKVIYSEYSSFHLICSPA